MHRDHDQGGTEREDAALPRRSARRWRVVTQRAGVRPAGDSDNRKPEPSNHRPILLGETTATTARRTDDRVSLHHPPAASRKTASISPVAGSGTEDQTVDDF